MAYQRSGLDITVPTVDTTIVQNGVVVLGTNGNVANPSAAAALNIVGVAQESYANTSIGGITVRIWGIAQCISDGSAAIDEGDMLVVATNTGKVKAATQANTGTLNGRVGIALTPATNTDGLLVDVLLAGPDAWALV